MIKSLFYILLIAGCASANTRIRLNTGEDLRKKIIVLETPIEDSQVNEDYMCKNGSVASSIGRNSHMSELELNFYGDSRVHHGTNIVGIIGSKIDKSKYCIYHISYIYPASEDSFGYLKMMWYYAAIRKASKLKNVVGINMSLASNNAANQFNQEELAALSNMTKRGIQVVVAAGNDNLDLTKENCFTYPACLQPMVGKPENFHVVGGVKLPWGVVHNPSSNKSEYLRMDLDAWLEQGTPKLSGTSQAAANFTGKLFSK